MNLVVYAVPFFILAMLAELAWGLWAGRNTYRLNDAVGSLFLGILSQARRLLTLGVGGYVYHLLTEYFSMPLMDRGHWFTWVLAFVLYDFCYYWLHRMGHERSILWAAHVAHHQSEDYNLSTALRQTSTGFLLGWIFYLPLFLLGVPAEVVVTVGSLNLIYQFWVHTEHLPKLGWYETLFVTPSNHRVHHAQNDLYLDRNYGGVFIVWDRLFGTFQEERPEEPCIYGIRGPLRSFSPVRALTHIYVDLFRDSCRTRRWRDKLRVWVARTGWRPADVETRWPRGKAPLAEFRKYDPATPGRVAGYAFAQLLAMIWLLDAVQSEPPPYWTGVCLWSVMIVSMTVTAAWLDGRSPALLLKLDALRLLGIAALLGWGWMAGTGDALLVPGLVYLTCNSLYLPLLAGATAAETAQSGALS